jgi:hypothetical protein
MDNTANNAADDVRTSAPIRKRRKGQRPTAEEKRRIQATFLEAFANNANMRAACKAAGVDRNTVYAWQEHDEAFSFRFKQAEADANDVIRAAIYQRGLQGIDKPLHWQGRMVMEDVPDPRHPGKMIRRRVTVKDYSDTLLIFLAKSRMPEFRDKVQLEQTGKVTVQYEFPDDPEAANLARALIRRLSSGGVPESGSAGVSGER